jgi:hypothetical protein
MAQITNLEELFAKAALDWTYDPPPPIRGGGRAPQVLGRTISVVATVTDGFVSTQIPFLGYTGTLYYTPERRAWYKGVPISIPANFSGTGTGIGTDDNQLFISIDAFKIGAEGYGTLLELRIEGSVPTPTLSFTTTPAGGTEDPTLSDPITAIMYAGKPTHPAKDLCILRFRSKTTIFF